MFAKFPQINDGQSVEIMDILVSINKQVDLFIVYSKHLTYYNHPSLNLLFYLFANLTYRKVHLNARVFVVHNLYNFSAKRDFPRVSSCVYVYDCR